MFCGHCGAENDDQTKFCTSCGRLLAEPAGSDAVAAAPPPPAEDDGRYKAPPPGSIPPPPPAAFGSGPSSGGYVQLENTSGMGGGHPLPPETQNMNFAGCLPCGIFAFLNGSALWGLITIAASLVFGNLAGLILVIKGNEFAWQNRRFESRQQYRETMDAWNQWGKVWFIFSLVMAVIGFIAYIALIVWAVSVDSGGMSGSGTTPF